MIVAVVAGFLLPLLACGPFFPNSLLTGGDEALLQAPQVRFHQELARLQLPATPGLTRVEPARTESERAHTLATEISDLRRHLLGGEADTGTVARVVLEFSRLRADLEEHRAAVADWESARARKSSAAAPEPEAGPDPADLPPLDKAAEPTTDATRPVLAARNSPGGLPREFELYLRGAIAWHDDQTNAARAAWSDLLALPVDQRRFKSTWASYMLGRSWHDADPAKATAFYQQTRKFTRAGLGDSLGLGAASLGWEAQLRLRTNDLVNALRLYLDQYATGDTNGAVTSLSFTAARILRATPEQRLAVARDPVFRRVITAWALADADWLSSWNSTPQDTASRGHEGWLETIQASGAAEVPLAEQLALLSYQMGDWTNASHWVELAPDSPVASWVRAKLLLRDGKLDAAATELANVVARFPLDPEPLPRGAPPEFVESLYHSEGDFWDVDGRHQAMGELGVLRLTRGEFVQSLDALLRAGFWQDAAYVAERVLTLDELKAYVDAHWPKSPPVAPPEATDAAPDPEAESEADSERWWTRHDGPEKQRAEIRHLLARRLMRANRNREAAPYFPVSLHESHAQLLELLVQGQNTDRPTRERARAWFEAAELVRRAGLGLMGTELAPDYAIWEGNYEEGPDSENRLSATNRLVRPGAAERKRLAEQPADPNLRFHYRYHAASLAWDAARLLPDNDPETAQMLYTAGGWLKARDPDTADIFYKALVRRCRKTELGDAADRQRWFPELDAGGHPIVTRKAPGAFVAPDPGEPTPPSPRE